jgi:hypothetical protein
MTIHPNFVQNSFQTPNVYIDEVLSYLTSNEYKVLSYAIRRILGFQKRQDRISISQFTHGVMKYDGSDYRDQGTGLCIGTVRKCLANLENFRLMIKLEKNNPRNKQGDLWALQWDGNINWTALKARKKQDLVANTKRVTKARTMRRTQEKA